MKAAASDFSLLKSIATYDPTALPFSDLPDVTLRIRLAVPKNIEGRQSNLKRFFWNFESEGNLQF